MRLQVIPIPTVLSITGALLLLNGYPAQARTIDLAFDYYVASTIDHEFTPSLHPDMDGDGQPDLEGQPNIDALLNALEDSVHPSHAEVLASFEFNETFAATALDARFPNQALVPYIAELWAVYMTIQGGGTFQGPTLTGMAGRVEALWVYLQMETVAGPFNLQAWQQSELFGGTAAEQAAIVATGGGVVLRGDRVVFAVTPTNAVAYVWFKDDNLVDGQAASTFVIDPVDFADAGDYYCVVTTGAKATLQTPTVTLTVGEAPSMPVNRGTSLLLLIFGTTGIFATYTWRYRNSSR